jgi:type IV pilus assembly protein PilC
MGSYLYVAKTRAGDETAGAVGANNLDEAVRSLHSRGLVVIRVTEEPRKGPRPSILDYLGATSLFRVGTRDLALFTSQLSTVLEAGIPLVRGLRGLAADTSKRTLSRVVQDLANRIESGESLSQAMEAHPEAFDRMYVSMIEAGERAGTLDQIMAKLATNLERLDTLKTKVRSALTYPIFLVSFALLATITMLVKVVPTFQGIYGELGQDLPGLTRLVLAASAAVRGNLLLLLAGAVFLILAIVLFVRTKTGRYFHHALLFRIPVFGSIVRKAVMSRFARTFGILLGSGLPILESLDLVREAVSNEVVGRALGNVRQQVSAGQEITAACRSSKVFPEMVLQMMATGEQSGEMDTMLLKVSDFYDRQVEAAVHGLTSLIEPVMIVVVGGLIAVIVISLFLPIFHLGEAMMRGGYRL